MFLKRPFCLQRDVFVGFLAINWQCSAVFPVVLGLVGNFNDGGVRRVADRIASRLHLLAWRVSTNRTSAFPGSKLAEMERVPSEVRVDPPARPRCKANARVIGLAAARCCSPRITGDSGSIFWWRESMGFCRFSDSVSRGRKRTDRHPLGC